MTQGIDGAGSQLVQQSLYQLGLGNLGGPIGQMMWAGPGNIFELGLLGAHSPIFQVLLQEREEANAP
uniref:Uncharacterized protein n=1 Tax=Ipomoea trifida TaxID=35884 RepID=A0A8X8_IPOTF|nr:hypothetical protein [Ipomoea trifida]